jgi:hypothetical protein
MKKLLKSFQSNSNIKKANTFFRGLALVFASIMLLHSEARADWQRFSENELGDIFFYDKADIKKNDIVTVWILINYQSPVRVNKSIIQSTKVMTQIYCKDKTIRSLASFEYSGFNGEGKLIRSSESSEAWATAELASPEEDIVQIVCNRK